MGWLCMTRAGMGAHATPKAYLDDQFTYPPRDDRRGLRVIKSVWQGRAYYAACQPYDTASEGNPFAVICLVRWNPKAANGEIFAYKDMDETVGPHEDECPLSVLEALGPSEHPFALDWRRRCYRNARLLRRRLADGDRIRFASPIAFTDGTKRSEFIVSQKGSRTIFICPTSGLGYRITAFRKMRFQIIPKTRIMKTVFAR